MVTDQDAAPTAATASSSTDEFSALAELARELVRIMLDGDLASLDVRRGDLRISLRKYGEPAPASAALAPPPQAAPIADGRAEPAGYVVTSPMIGTFYVASAPGERPFVEVGDRVEVGQPVAIIEAMKIMNEIIAERSGVVTEIFVTNGEAVEYGHPLMRLREE